MGSHGGLKARAAEIDARLNAAKYQTFVHGDAKLANFCFSQDDSRVAAVDFQYVGGGCGMKDVAYFMGCFSDGDGFRDKEGLVDFYFEQLRAFYSARTGGKGPIDMDEV